jgi:tRNA(Arg) A34 adenosine deaminase TadA
MSDVDYMRMAIEKARAGIAAGQSPFGSVIVRGGEVLACEHNLVWATPDATAHAEVTAIRAACRKVRDIKLAGSTLYSTTEPCPMCFSAIHWAGIDTIVYGASIADAQNAGFSELSISNFDMKRLGGSPVEIVPGFMAAEAVALFGEWLASAKARAY